MDKTAEGTCFNLGSIAYGQSKDLLIPISSESLNGCRFTLTYQNAKNIRKTIEFDLATGIQQADPNSIMRHKMRLEFVHYVRTRWENMTLEKNGKRKHDSQQTNEKTMNELQKFEENLKLIANENDEFIKDLLTDLTGQVREAVDIQASFNKWGKHYLPSLTRKLKESLKFR